MMPTKITVFQIADKIFSFVIENSHIYFVTHNVHMFVASVELAIEGGKSTEAM